MLRRRLRTLGNLGMGETHCKNFRLGKGVFSCQRQEKEIQKRREFLAEPRKRILELLYFFVPFRDNRKKDTSFFAFLGSRFLIGHPFFLPKVRNGGMLYSVTECRSVTPSYAAAPHALGLTVTRYESAPHSFSISFGTATLRA